MIERVRAFFRSLRQFERPFWVANVSELFERIAFYGMTTILVLYLTKSRGLDNSIAIVIGGYFGFLTYGLAAASGFVADLIGYRRAMVLAYSLLAVGYFLTGQSRSLWPILASLLLVAVGASLIKPAITGTVQKTCTEAQRPVGFSIYYMLVNVGGFVGPNLSGQVRDRVGVDVVFLFSTAAALVALLLALLLFREPASRAGSTERRRASAFLGDFLRVLVNPRLLLLFLFVAGFWSMFFQFYGPLPLYFTDDLKGSAGLLGFVVSLDAGMVVCFQVVVGYLVRKLDPSRAILLAVLISSAGIGLIGIVPSVSAVVAGVLVFSVGEMIYSAHFYRYLGSIAPPDQVGMYMGFAFLPIAVGYLLSGLVGGPVLAYCRDALHMPRLMWFAFAGVGLVSALGLAALNLFSRPRARS